MSVFVVVGPTASGKTALGVALAKATGGEVVNADAMQCYRGMDIGTAKPTLAERDGIAHHCLDLWEPCVEAGVALWRDAAVAAIEEVLGRTATAVVVGGSGLYVRALLEEWELPGTDPGLRAELESELARDGSAALHARLAAVDPQAAGQILATNGRRIVRALEVVMLTGRPFPARLPVAVPPRWGAVCVGLEPDAEILDSRVMQRVDRMWNAGLVQEVTAIRDGIGFGRTAARALGYAQVLTHLAGLCTSDEARDATATLTRRFVRRQRSWWRGDGRVRWLPATYDPAGSLITDPLVSGLVRSQV